MAIDHGLQQLIGAALIDSSVQVALLRNPLSLASRFGLSIPERRFLATAQPRDLEHFAIMVEGWVGGHPPTLRRYTGDLQVAQRAG